MGLVGPSLTIGVVSFALPFLAAFMVCYGILHWHLHAAEIGGIALSTTSVAVVYAVMVETGLNRHDIGKLILAACFVTDLGTVLALGGFFATYGWLWLLFVALTVLALFVVPPLLRSAITHLGHRVSEPEIKLILVVLFALGGLATQAGRECSARRERSYTTLLMATGLTFGSISALFGYTPHLISRTQYAELLTVVVVSAFVPTIIAQPHFQPKVVDAEEEKALGAEDASAIHRARSRIEPGLVGSAGGDDGEEL